jgi:hypothetical protein
MGMAAANSLVTNPMKTAEANFNEKFAYYGAAVSRCERALTVFINPQGHISKAHDWSVTCAAASMGAGMKNKYVVFVEDAATVAGLL